MHEQFAAIIAFSLHLRPGRSTVEPVLAVVGITKPLGFVASIAPLDAASALGRSLYWSCSALSRVSQNSIPRDRAR